VPLSRDSRNLARLAARDERDAALDGLITLAEAQIPVSVTVVLDSGHTVTGELGTEIDWGQHLDSALDDAFAEAAARARERGDDQAAERWERWRDIPKSNVSFGRRAADQNAKEERVREQTKDTPTTAWGYRDWDEIRDDDLAELVIRSVERRRTLTLTNASLAPPGGSPENVPDPGLIRIETAHVAAWYPGM
jgi:hypothetical protein